MFRFYRLTTFTEGTVYIDFNGLADWQDVKDELEAGGPLEGEVISNGVTIPFRRQDFLIYEG